MSAAQKQALRVNAIKYYIDKTSDTHYIDSVTKRQKVKQTLLVHFQFWLRVNIENVMTRLGPTWNGYCVRSITYNAVTSGTHTNHNQSRKMTNIKAFGISILKQINKVIEHSRPDIVCTNK